MARYPSCRTRNPWYQISRDRAFQYGANFVEKLHDVTCIVQYYSDPHHNESIPCACGGEAWWRDTVGGSQCCTRCRAFPLLARQQITIEREAGKILRECEEKGVQLNPSQAERLEELRIEWKNSKLYNS
jgi:hypothetical protein